MISRHLDLNIRNDGLAIWNKTEASKRRLASLVKSRKKGLFGKEESFQDRLIISRDKRINKGVYLGGGEREAIVVDDHKDPALNRVYQELLSMRNNALAQGIPFKQGILSDVFNLVNKVMPYDDEKVQI